MTAQVFVVGAGAAGLTSAIFAAQRGLKVCVLEGTKEAGKKILVSGGSRCNLLPGALSKNPKHPDFYSTTKFARVAAILNLWPHASIFNWMEKDIKIPMVQEESTGKWFPRENSARVVRDLLLQKAESLGVEFCYNSKVTAIRKHEETFVITTKSSVFRCKHVILASGGLSYPALGANISGLNILTHLGHKMVPTYPALTPLLGPHPGELKGFPERRQPLCVVGVGLQGVSLVVDITVINDNKVVGQSQKQGFLFTHKGFSGPSILDISHFFSKTLEGAEQSVHLYVNWGSKTAQFWQDLLLDSKHSKKTIPNIIQMGEIPFRLAEAICIEVGVRSVIASSLTAKDRMKLIEKLTMDPLQVTGHAGYQLAEVTGGGVSLDDVGTSSMESLKVPGLHLCGEVLDVFGRIGGYNFLWAWVTGYLAGSSVAHTKTPTE